MTEGMKYKVGDRVCGKYNNMYGTVIETYLDDIYPYEVRWDLKGFSRQEEFWLEPAPDPIDAAMDAALRSEPDEDEWEAWLYHTVRYLSDHIILLTASQKEGLRNILRQMPWGRCGKGEG